MTQVDAERLTPDAVSRTGLAALPPAGLTRLPVLHSLDHMKESKGYRLHERPSQ